MEISTIPIIYAGGLVRVSASVIGVNRRIKLRCAIDTACSITTIRTDLIDYLGYSAKDGEEISNVISSTGSQQSYTLKIKSLRIGEIYQANFLVDAADLSEVLDIDCLIGNNWLDQFIVKIDYQNQNLTLSRPNR